MGLIIKVGRLKTRDSNVKSQDKLEAERTRPRTARLGWTTPRYCSISLPVCLSLSLSRGIHTINLPKQVLSTRRLYSVLRPRGYLLVRVGGAV